MSTRSFISKKIANGTYVSIYCHFDGYPEHHAVILEKCYYEEKKVNKLIRTGDIVSLYPDIKDIEIDSQWTNREAKKSSSLKKLIKQARTMHARWLYIFANNKKWYFLEL